MNDLSKAKEYLKNGEFTCVLCSKEEVYTSTLRGVKPLVTWLESGINFEGFSAADKVIGKATAFLYTLLKVKSVYARVISKSALQALNDYNIDVEYHTITENIINRQGTGICPFEQAVLETSDASKALELILNKMKELNL